LTNIYPDFLEILKHYFTFGIIADSAGKAGAHSKLGETISRIGG
jgi:hypothetical protein